KEERTRNPVMATVGRAIQRQHEILTAGGIRTTLEWNPGNHFMDSDKRTAKGIAWLLAQAQ
ncbi:MAG: esterase, partial [Clostridia bacterium]|nr:esterase [Clostridia bacterium]